MEENVEPLVKICLIGSESKRKREFIRNYTGETVGGSGYPTLGVEITTIRITVNSNTVKLILVETAGHEFFGKLRPNYYRGASGVIIIFDKGDYRSFTEVPNWLKEFRDNHEAKIPDSIKKKYYSHQPPPDPTPVVLVGLITDTNEVSFEEAQALADQLDIPYFECVPTDGKELGKVIKYLTKKINEA